MGATLFNDHKVYRMDLGIDDGSLLGSETVIVIDKHCEKNVYPHIYKWSISFVGGVDAFMHRYLPDMGYLFDDGCNESEHFSNSSAFIAHLKHLFQSAGPLSISELHSMGFYGYSWPDESLSRLDVTTHLKAFSSWLGARHAAPLDTENDLIQMIRDAYAYVAFDPNNYWLSCLWCLDEDQMLTVKAADAGAELVL